MDPVERVAQAIWEATPVAAEYPWGLLRGRLRVTMLAVAKGVIEAVSREVAFMEPPKEPMH